MSDVIEYWSRLGLEPTVAFELRDGRLGYAYRMDKLENGNVRFAACVVFEERGPYAYSICEVPAELVARVEPFTPSRKATLGDFLQALREGLFGGGRK